jgi:hypothetical protein
MNAGKNMAVEATRRHLLQSSANLLVSNDALGLALRHFFPELKLAFVMNWIPEQGEDIYWVLISSTEVAEVEIPRGIGAESNSPSLKIVALDAYQKKRHSRDVRHRLEVGVELVKSS